MGMYCTISAAAAKTKLSEADGDSSLSLEKAWHGLHYLLTGNAWDGDGPLAFLLMGGEQMEDSEDSPRFFSARETAEIHLTLSGVTDDELWSRFDAEAMEEQEIYPQIWDEEEEDLKDEYLTYFHELKVLVANANAKGEGLIVSIG